MSTKLSSHSAGDAAIGFYYQSLYGLFNLLNQVHDDATICLERLDDVEVTADGQSLLIQLKHTLAAKPVPVSLNSRAIWRTLKAWIDVLPNVEITQTKFQLVTVAPLSKKSELRVLLDETSDRTVLNDQLLKEAHRILHEHQTAVDTSTYPLPHTDRIAGCKAFVELGCKPRKALLERMTIHPAMSDITNISSDIAKNLVNFPPMEREKIALRLIEWWDIQVIFSLCGKRQRFITRLEALEKVSEIAGEIARDELFPDFENALLPKDHIPDSIIVRQIELVDGTLSDIRLAVREEWRARSQRHKWCTERLGMATRIELYDQLLLEAWQDHFDRMCEGIVSTDEASKQKNGRELLHWSYDDALKEIRPFVANWAGVYYIRGSYQILAIDLKVGWHPQFQEIL